MEFKSQEERDFYSWLLEAKEYQFIESFEYEPQSWILCEKTTYQVENVLKTKTKMVDKHLFHEHSYTPDFIVKAGKRWHLLQDSHKLLSFHGNKDEYVIDTKGSFQLHDGARSFSINQKWMYDKHGIYVNKVIPEKFFKLTWVPEDCKLTKKTKKPRKKFQNLPTLREKFIV